MAIISAYPNYHICRSTSPEKLSNSKNKDKDTSDTVKENETSDFVSNFNQLFTAAGAGDLRKCQEIVLRTGFFDFHAFSVGKFTDPKGNSLDAVTIMQVAERMGHTELVKYFKDQEKSKKESISKRKQFTREST